MKKLFYLSLLFVFFIASNSYADNICSSTSSTASSGTIYDSGGAGSAYSNNEDCGFLIQPAAFANSITLSFSQFQVENGWDYLYVYDGTNTSGALLGTFTGYTLPSSVTATTGSMYLRFVSDYIYSYQGFTASWTSTNIATPSTTPIVEYRFDACTLAGSVEDTQGNYNGVATGSDSTATSSVSGGRSLDLSATGTADWVTVPKAAINGLDAFSFSVWIKTGTSSDEQNIIQALGSSTGDDELQIFLKDSDEVKINIKDDNETLSANNTLTDNAWHHLVITRQNDDVCLYVDGSQTDCDSGVNTGALSVPYDNSVVIGQEQDSYRNSPALNSGFSSSQSFKGFIDELKIYNSALNAAQILAIYNNESSGNNTSNCSGGGNSCVTFRDEFSTESYSRQDGTANWSSNWDEYEGTSPTIPEASPNPASGHVQIVGGQLVLNNYSTETQNFPGVERELDLSTFSSATFSFDFVTSGDVDSSDSVVVMASANGGTNWTVLEDIRGINDTSGSKNYDLTSYISSNTKIRIRINNETVSGLGSGCCYGASPETFSIDNVQIEACGAGGGGGDTPATAFNCVENGADGIAGKLYTKTTAQSYSFDIVALQDASTIESSFASGTDHTVTVELVDASAGGSCTGYAALNPAVSQSLLFTSSDSGIKASALMTSGTAYSTVMCRVTDATDSPSVIGCSTDSFAIRPTGFSITSNLSNTGSTGTPKAKAGENFSLTATATTGYNGTPAINHSNIQAHTGAIQSGSITGVFGAANSVTGVATGSAFSYSEVGSLRFSAQGIYDASFTSVDQSSDCTDDFSNSVDGNGKVGCKFGNTASSNYFGRFTPDHFDVTLNTPVFAPGCSAYTYFGQAVKYAVAPVATVTAKNTSGSTTQNYTGSFWKINPASLTPNYSEATVPLNVLQTSAPSVADSSNGSGTLTYADTSSNILALTKGSVSAPYDAEIALSFSLVDTDSIGVANVDGSAQSNPVTFGAATSGNGINFTGGNKTHRWGRAVLTNAHGSELTPLVIPVTTEYYNGSALVKNTLDNCTNFTLANDFSISDAADFNCSFSTQNSPVAVGAGSVKANMNTTTVSGGRSELLISDNAIITNGPGAGNTGYIDLTSNLSNLPWLLYDWDADGSHDNCPSARATFGLYKGNSRQIYFREVY